MSQTKTAYVLVKVKKDKHNPKDSKNYNTYFKVTEN